MEKDIELNSTRLKMARIPNGADMINNPISVAPGFQIKNVFNHAEDKKISCRFYFFV